MNTKLWLTPAQAQALVAAAQRAAPREACGVIGGKGSVVQRVLALDNVAANPQTHYVLDGADFVRAWAALEKEGLDLLGIYHSHPKGEALPSSKDIQDAAYPDAVYVIIGLAGAKAQLAGWRIVYGQVTAVELCMGTPTGIDENVTLSRAQRFAIILSAVLALLFLLLLALSLLPPAPVIPVR
ncbi:MAG: M67 family metallopeptidase [Chloroflexi bacterium]|nr:M67 family metallopeptidase [Chloroflexota bacterium]